MANWQFLCLEQGFGDCALHPTSDKKATQLGPNERVSSCLKTCQSQSQSQSQSYITTDSQSASLYWCQAPIWDPRPIFPLLALIIFRQLRVCWCGAPSLTRSRACSFQFLLGITSAAFLRSESHGTHEHILLSLFLRLPQPGGPGSCIYFPQEQGSPVIPPGHWVYWIHQSESESGSGSGLHYD
jgi:hypothetical protein